MKVKLIYLLFLIHTSCTFSSSHEEKSDQEKEYERYGLDVISTNEFIATKKAKELCRKGVDLGLEGKYEEAEKIFKKALIAEPNNTVIINNIGLTLYNRELFNEAIEYYNHALILSDSTNLMAATNLGLAYSQQMDYPRALKILNFTIKKSRNDNTAMLIARLNRLMVNIELENCSEMEKDRKAIEYLRYNNHLEDFKEKIDLLDAEINKLCSKKSRNDA